MKTVKSVGYAYPSSPLATKHRQGNGCFYLSTFPAGQSKSEKVLSVHPTLEAAHVAADALPYPHDRYSMPRMGDTPGERQAGDRVTK
jgi:hypothetical protein